MSATPGPASPTCASASAMIEHKQSAADSSTSNLGSKKQLSQDTLQHNEEIAE